MATQVATYGMGRVDPLRCDDPPLSRRVNLKVSSTFAAGAILGEVTATPGAYATYASGNSDGSQNPTLILQYACKTDSSGNVTLGDGTSGGDWHETSKSAACWIPGGAATWDCSLIPNLDANAVTKLGGHLVAGTVSSGEVVL